MKKDLLLWGSKLVWWQVQARPGSKCWYSKWDGSKMVFGDHIIVIKPSFRFICMNLKELKLRQHQPGCLCPYFFHIPLVNSLEVRWLILCLTRKDRSLSQMLQPAVPRLVHSRRESPNHRLLAGRQTLADSHLWPTMKHHLLWMGGGTAPASESHCGAPPLC